MPSDDIFGGGLGGRQGLSLTVHSLRNQHDLWASSDPCNRRIQYHSEISGGPWICQGRSSAQPMARSNDGSAAVVLQVTDSHLLAAPDSQMRGVTTQATFLAVFDYARKDPRWPPDAVLVTGDIVEDESRAGYERFRQMLSAYECPVFCVPGNHDNPALMAELLMTPPFQVGGDAKLGEWRVLLLSTFQRGESAGAIGPDGLTELDASLKKFSNEHVLICLHHQPLPMGSAWLDSIGLRDADQFLAIIDRYSRVRGVVWGHVHQASDRERNKVQFMSTPSTCSQFLPHSDSFALDNRPPGLRWLELGPDGRIATEVEWIDPAKKT